MTKILNVVEQSFQVLFFIFTAEMLPWNLLKERSQIFIGILFISQIN